MEDQKLENQVEREPWKPRLREVISPFRGSHEYANRWTNYFYDKGWPLMSINEENKEIEKNPSFAQSERYIASRKFHRVQRYLAWRDVAFVYSTLGGGLALLDFLTRK